MCRGRLLSEGRSQPGGERPKEGDGDVYPSCMLSLLFAGADCLAKGARNLEENDPKKAMVMVEEALNVYTSEGKGMQALDIYR